MIKKKNTYSQIFDDFTLAFGLIKRMNGFHFCHSGDQELKRLGFILQSQPGIKPYITAKGKKFLMDVYEGLADKIPEDKPKEDPKKNKVQELVKNLKDKPKRAYHEPQIEDEDEEDDEDEMEVPRKEKKEKPENDSQT